jgi:GAF domain-containing protein
MPALADRHRLAAIARSDLFPGVPEPTFDPYVRLVARLLDVPTALVTIVTDDLQFFPAQIGLGEPWASRGETPIELSMCQHVVLGDAPLVVEDGPHDERVASTLAVTEMEVVAYLGVPLRSPEGLALGTICAVDDEPRLWQERDIAVLQDVADAVSQAIALRTSEHLWAQFASDVSHQLRTPVAAMRFELDDLATWDSLDDEARGVVRAAAEQAIDLSKQVDELTEVARQRRRFGAVDLDLRAELATATAAAGVGPDDLGLEVSGPDSAPATIATSPTALRHTLLELVRLVVGSAPASGLRAEVEPLEGWWRLRIAPLHPPVHAPSVPDDLADLARGQLGARLASDLRSGGYELVLPAR